MLDKQRENVQKCWHWNVGFLHLRLLVLIYGC